ncbi:MAG: hypothetical protein ACI90V_011370, partial [Bacillariaceae sp.]
STINKQTTKNTIISTIKKKLPNFPDSLYYFHNIYTNKSISQL